MAMITKDTPVQDILNLAPACKCTACSHGCTMGSGFLADADVKPLAVFLKVSEQELKEDFLEEVELFNKKMLRPKVLREGKPYGKCIFFDKDKGCTVHDAKPLQCKTSMGCKEYGEDLAIWFMLNHMIDANDPEAIRQFSQYLASGGKTLEKGGLKDLVQDEEKLKKMLSYEMLK